jgi:hypothetical protein
MRASVVHSADRGGLRLGVRDLGHTRRHQLEMIAGSLAVFAFCALLLSCAHHAAPAVTPTSEPSAPEATAEEVKQRPTEDERLVHEPNEQSLVCLFIWGDPEISESCDTLVDLVTQRIQVLDDHGEVSIKLQGTANFIYEGFAGEPRQKLHFEEYALFRPHPNPNPISSLMAFERAADIKRAIRERLPASSVHITIDNAEYPYNDIGKIVGTIIFVGEPRKN